MNRMTWVLGLALVLMSTVSFADSVIRDGKEWLQPADFLNLSYNDVVAVCPAPDFVCNGLLNGIDVSGFTFAPIEQVIDLFNSYGIDPPLGPAPADHGPDTGSWALAFFQDFTPVFFIDGLPWLWAWSASLKSPGYAYGGYVVSRQEEVAVYHEAGTFDFAVDYNSQGEEGVFLFRQAPFPSSMPTAVPTMSTYVLIFTILGLIAVASGALFRRKLNDG